MGFKFLKDVVSSLLQITWETTAKFCIGKKKEKKEKTTTVQLKDVSGRTRTVL